MVRGYSPDRGIRAGRPHHMDVLKALVEFRDTALVIDTARVYLIPVQVMFPITVDRIMGVLLNVSAGNHRAGIYEDGTVYGTPEGGALVVESASVAKPAAWNGFAIPIADTYLAPARYWLAVQSDETTTEYASAEAMMPGIGYLNIEYYDRAGGYGAFTDPCPATTEDNVPWLAARVTSVP